MGKGSGGDGGRREEKMEWNGRKRVTDGCKSEEKVKKKRPGIEGRLSRREGASLRGCVSRVLMMMTKEDCKKQGLLCVAAGIYSGRCCCGGC